MVVASAALDARDDGVEEVEEADWRGAVGETVQCRAKVEAQGTARALAEGPQMSPAAVP